jgi:hypothetical protein
MNPVCTLPFILRSSKLSSVTRFFYCLCEGIIDNWLRFGLYISCTWHLNINFTLSCTSFIHINVKIECNDLCVHIYDSLEYHVNESMLEFGVCLYSKYSMRSFTHHIGLYVCLLQIKEYCCTAYCFWGCYLTTLSNADIIWHWSKAFSYCMWFEDFMLTVQWSLLRQQAMWMWSSCPLLNPWITDLVQNVSRLDFFFSSSWWYGVRNLAIFLFIYTELSLCSAHIFS